MKLYAIDAGNFKLDGGAMFGVVPKTIWSRHIPSDELNLCNWKMRCLLIENQDQLILIDTGMGDKQSEKWQSYYYKNGEWDLLSSIKSYGFDASQITDVILTHLHFDHAGGAVSRDNSKDIYMLTFPNANYWVHSAQWQWAVQPNIREKASFLYENLQPIFESGQLKFIDVDGDSFFGEVIEFLFVDGHTEKMTLPLIHHPKQKILFAADLVPSFVHLHLPYVMGYDIRPLISMQEKQKVLERVVNENILLYFDHDLKHELAEIQVDERGFSAVGFTTLSEMVV